MSRHQALLALVLLCSQVPQITLVAAEEVVSLQAQDTCPSGYQSDSEGRCRALAVGVMQLDPYALENYVLKHEVVMVSFCTAADGKCRLLAPELSAAAAETGSTGVQFVSVDIAEHVLARSIYGITTVPTLRFFIKGRMMEEDYRGRRLAADLLEVTVVRAGDVNKSTSDDSGPSQIVELSGTSLRELTHDINDVNLFVLYYSSPCSALFLELEAVARTFTALKNITIAKVDVLQYPEAFDRYALHGTPLMVFYAQADPFFGFKPKQVVYADVRVAPAIVRFLNRKCGLKEVALRMDGMVDDDIAPHSLPGAEDRDAPSWIFAPAGDTES